MVGFWFGWRSEQSHARANEAAQGGRVAVVLKVGLGECGQRQEQHAEVSADGLVMREVAHLKTETDLVLGSKHVHRVRRVPEWDGQRMTKGLQGITPKQVSSPLAGVITMHKVACPIIAHLRVNLL